MEKFNNEDTFNFIDNINKSLRTIDFCRFLHFLKSNVFYINYEKYSFPNFYHLDKKDIKYLLNQIKLISKKNILDADVIHLWYSNYENKLISYEKYLFNKEKNRYINKKQISKYIWQLMKYINNYIEKCGSNQECIYLLDFLERIILFHIQIK